MTRSVFLTFLVAGQRMKREVKKDEEGDGGLLRDTALAWSVCCCKLGEGESKKSKRGRPETSRPTDPRTAEPLISPEKS